jgi:type I restriction enzyme S subunit
VWKTVKDCGTVVTGTTPSKKDPANYGNYMPFVKPPELKNSSVFSAEDNLSERGTKSARVLPPGSVLVSCIGNLGKTGINRVPVAFNQQINAIIFAGEIMPEFGFYYFQSSEFKGLLEGVSSATTVTIVNKSKFESLPFPNPPLPEQERIVARLEELLSDVEAGTAALERVRAGVKRYKASALKAAFTGRLFGDRPDGLPEGWIWTTIGQITLPIEKVRPEDKPDIPFVYIDISSIDNSIQRIVEPKEYLGVDAPSRARQLVHSNDIVFSTVRTYLNNIALVPEKYDGQVASTGFSILRASDAILPKFLFYYTLTDEFLSPLNELQRGTSYPAVRDGDVRVQPVPLPPLEEQRRIVIEVERRLESARAVESAVEAGLKRSGRLRQAVLRSAFEGRLM